MKPPYRILQVVSSHQLSGAERIVQLIGRHINRALFRLVVVCAGDPLKKIYGQDGHIVETAGVIFPSPGSIIRLKSIMDKWKIHLIHAHDHRASLLSLITARCFTGLPVISHIHSANPWLGKCHVFRLADFLLRNRYDISIACSENVRNYYLKNNLLLKPEKITTVCNGVEVWEPEEAGNENILENLGVPGRHFVYGTVGRLSYIKGIDILLRAFKIVASRLQNVALVVVGNGPDEEYLKNLTVDLNLSKHVFFAGFRDDARKIMKIFNVFVLASRYEGLPMVLMEAMAGSLPVIAANVGGIEELVIPGETGILVTSGSVEELAEKMILLYHQQSFAAKLAGSGCRLVCEKFDVKKQVRLMETIYLSLLESEAACSELLS